MAAEVNGQRVRRTQAERTAAMRARLLDATIECLVTYGYAGTTTPRVAQLAGVTRGAQIHHFRSKEDLVVAAIEHLAQQRAQGAIRELGRVQSSPDPVSMVLDFYGRLTGARCSLPRLNFGWQRAQIPCWPARSSG